MPAEALPFFAVGFVLPAVALVSPTAAVTLPWLFQWQSSKPVPENWPTMPPAQALPVSEEALMVQLFQVKFVGFKPPEVLAIDRMPPA